MWRREEEIGKAEQIVCDDGCDHEKNIYRFSPAVEDKAYRQDSDITPSDRAKKVDQKRYGKKQKQKFQRREYHFYVPFFCI